MSTDLNHSKYCWMTDIWMTDDYIHSLKYHGARKLHSYKKGSCHENALVQNTIPLLICHTNMQKVSHFSVFWFPILYSRDDDNSNLSHRVAVRTE